MAKLLYVFDVDQIWIRRLVQRFEPEGWLVVSFSDSEEMIRMVIADAPRVLLIDTTLPGGMQVLDAVKKGSIVFATIGRGSGKNVFDGYQQGADFVITKTGNIDELWHMVRVADSMGVPPTTSSSEN